MTAAIDQQVDALQAIDVQRDEASAGFFEAAAHGRLAIRQCARCLAMSEPAASRCPVCGAADMTWVPVSGEGSLVTWSVPHGRPGPDGTTQPIRVLALVELAEGPWLHVPLIAVAEQQLRVGLPLRVLFVDHVSGERSPVFTRRESR